MRLDVIHTDANKLFAIRVDEPPNAIVLFDVDESRRVFSARRTRKQNKGEHQSRGSLRDPTRRFPRSPSPVGRFQCRTSHGINPK